MSGRDGIGHDECYRLARRGSLRADSRGTNWIPRQHFALPTFAQSALSRRLFRRVRPYTPSSDGGARYRLARRRFSDRFQRQLDHSRPQKIGGVPVDSGSGKSQKSRCNALHVLNVHPKHSSLISSPRSAHPCQLRSTKSSSILCSILLTSIIGSDIAHPDSTLRDKRAVKNQLGGVPCCH
jgi:hypothetical protein